MVPGTGLEPAHRKALGSKPSMSTNSITPAYWHHKLYNILRGQELNLLSSGYEPDEIPFLHPALHKTKQMAGKPGFEPGRTASKAAILPLDDFPITTMNKNKAQECFDNSVDNSIYLPIYCKRK